MLLMVAAAIAKGGPKLKLSGETVADTKTEPTNATAGFRINQDGTIDEQSAGSYTQVDGTTDWIIPNDLAPGDYEVRYTNVSGTGAGDETATAAEDTWYELSSGAFEVTLTASVVESKSITFDFEIRDGADNTRATGEYTITVTQNSSS